MRRRALLSAIAVFAGCSTSSSESTPATATEIEGTRSTSDEASVSTATAVSTDGSMAVFLHVVPADPSDEEWERAVPIVVENLPAAERDVARRAIDEECVSYDDAPSGAWAFTERVFDYLQVQRDAAEDDESYRTVYLDSDRIYAVGAVQGDHIMTEVDGRCPDI